jgi:hypothetical protein
MLLDVLVDNIARLKENFITTINDEGKVSHVVQQELPVVQVGADQVSQVV